MQAKIKIHFVCRGNVYRSRVAEAYMKALKGSKWDITSSGIDADKFANRQLGFWAKTIAHKFGFDGHFSPAAVQTTSQLLSEQDIIIFMRGDVFEDALRRFKFNADKSLVWNIKDREDWPKQISILQRRRRTFKHMRRGIQQLIRDIEHGGWVDIVDEHNASRGFSLPISIANKNGLWHRSCHAIVTTPSRHTLVQKRSAHIIFSPNLLDISLGGHVDTGEHPKQATLREIQEETGLRVSDVRLLEIHKMSSYHPRYKRYTKCFLYTYHVPLPDDHPVLTPQKNEVAALLLLEPSALHKLLRRYSLQHVGQLNYPHAFYKKCIEQIGL